MSQEIGLGGGILESLPKSKILNGGLPNSSNNIAFSPDSRFAAVAFGEYVDIWETETATHIRKIPSSTNTKSVSFVSKDRLAIGSETGDLSIYDLSTTELVSSWKAYDEGVSKICGNASGVLVTQSSNGQIKTWSSEDGTELGRIEWPRGAFSLSSDGTRVFVQSGADISVFSTKLDGAILTVSLKTSKIHQIRFCDEQQVLRVACEPDTVFSLSGKK